MKIALLTYSTKPRGGVVHTLHLAEALTARGHEVCVWSLARGGDGTFFRDVDPSVELRLVPFPDLPGESVAARIERSIISLRESFTPEEYDVVHAQDCISANAVGGRCIRTIHHLDRFTTPRLIECHELAITEPEALVCVSRSVATELSTEYGLTAEVIPNGVDTGPFIAAASPSAAPDRKFWQDKLGPYLLAVGGIEPRKGSIDLLEACALLREKHPQLSLVFAGGETLFDYREYRRSFEQRSRELGFDCTILGTVPQDQMAPLVAAASAFPFVSTHEGFGLAPLEALAAGVPVVARDLSVIREVLGNSVLYADTVSGMAEALDAALSGQAAPPQDGRALAQSYTWSAAAELTESFYNRVLAQQQQRQHHLLGANHDRARS